MACDSPYTAHVTHADPVHFYFFFATLLSIRNHVQGLTLAGPGSS